MAKNGNRHNNYWQIVSAVITGMAIYGLIDGVFNMLWENHFGNNNNNGHSCGRGCGCKKCRMRMMQENYVLY